MENHGGAIDEGDKSKGFKKITRFSLKSALDVLLIKIKQMKKLILHVPHSSIKIPLKEGFVSGEDLIFKEILKLTDWYTDDLFYSEKDEMVIAEFSRIFCDVERFSDDTQEVMAQYGMGVLYEKNDVGNIIRTINPTFRDFVLQNYYWPHHINLSKAVNAQLQSFGKAVIIDCHSYPSKPLFRDLDQRPDRPDFNIGTDLFHTPPYLVELAKAYFKDKGYSLGIDWPYRGSIVPLEHYGKNKNVETIMLEINRAFYLKEPGNEKSENYQEIKNITAGFIKMIRENSINY